MRHVRSLDFDALEARKLLTRSHLAIAHAAPAVAEVSLVLDGTLTVNNKAASTIVNDDGSTTTSTPVAGVLGGLGEVRGVWNASVDADGDYLGPDTLRLHDPQGAFVVVFNNANPKIAQRTADGVVLDALPQRIYAGTHAYVRASESGTIALTTNPARTLIKSLTLDSRNP